MIRTIIKQTIINYAINNAYDKIIFNFSDLDKMQKLIAMSDDIVQGLMKQLRMNHTPEQLATVSKSNNMNAQLLNHLANGFKIDFKPH